MAKSPLISTFAALALASPSCSRRGVSEQGPAPVRPGADGERALTLLTYNVLADEARAAKRAPALLRIIGESRADVIALQEVVPWFVAILEREEWARDYNSTAESIAPPRTEFLILSKLPITGVKQRTLPGRQGRRVLVATLDVGGRTMAVGTVHLESLLEEGPTRARQLDVVFPVLDGADDAVLLGDFNFGDGEKPETSRLGARYTDLWLALRPLEPGFTWDIEKSEMARRGSFPGEKSRRIDRILVRSELWRPSAIRIIGDEPVVAGRRGLFPSDHFGLVGVIER